MPDTIASLTKKLAKAKADEARVKGLAEAKKKLAAAQAEIKKFSPTRKKKAK